MSGLLRVAKQCGGLIVKSGGKTVRYDANGKIKKRARKAKRPLTVPQETTPNTLLGEGGENK